jgi:hypothetical protein
MMTASDLYLAADQIDAKASILEALVSDPLRDRQAKEVAQQLRDRSGQIRSWAERAERSGVTNEMEAGTRDFLRYAGLVLDGSL